MSTEGEKEVIRGIGVEIVVIGLCITMMSNIALAEGAQIQANWTTSVRVKRKEASAVSKVDERCA